MGPRKPEIEYIHLPALRALKEQLKQQHQQHEEYADALDCLRRLAQGALKKGPFSVTFEKDAPHIAASGDKRDFLSYAPYFWPPNGGSGKYVRRDGERNPDCRVVKDQAQLEAFAENLTFLCLGYHLLEKDEYAAHAVKLVDTFLVNDETRMNPNVDYGQVIRGESNPTGKGRGEGIISTRSLARVVNVLPLIAEFPAYAHIAPVVQRWFSDYLLWLRESAIGKEEAAMENNHLTWYLVQVAAIQQFLGVFCARHTTELVFFTQTFPKQVDPKSGDQPLESKRTRPFHYLEFNLHAAVFLAEMGMDLEYNAYQANQLLAKATRYMISTCKQQDDPTVAVRTVEIVQRRGATCDDDDGGAAYTTFLNMARNSEFAENISGPKHAICRLWSPLPPPPTASAPAPAPAPQADQPQSHASTDGKGLKGFFKQLLHHSSKK